MTADAGLLPIRKLKRTKQEKKFSDICICSSNLKSLFKKSIENIIHLAFVCSEKPKIFCLPQTFRHPAAG